MATASVNGIKVHYEREGTGPPLLFLNGSTATIGQVRPLLSVYTARFDVIVHDQRGLGRTEVAPGPYTMADYAADALALLDHVGLDTCRVVGTSFGGMVAQELAVTAPDRVERLALLCTSPGGEGGSSYPLHELRDLPADERLAITTRIIDSRFDDRWLAEHPVDRMMVDGLAGRTAAPDGSDVARGERLQLEARAGHDVWDRLGRIACPTLVACGRYDGIAPPSNSEAIASRIPGAELRVYEGGHGFFAQDPAAFPEILDFLAG